MFLKHTPPANRFSPFYSWDAQMGLRLAVLRRAAGALALTAVVQTVGTENLGSKVSVGGTGYRLGIAYLHARSDDVTLSIGLSHLSSHLTRDLDDKLDEARARNSPIPVVTDPDEYNVVFFGVRRRFSGHPLEPELEIVVHPVNFRLDFGRGEYVRPIGLESRWTLWRGARTRLAAETRHELGRHPLHGLSLLFEVQAAREPGHRFQLFFTVTPGGDLHVSPMLGGVRGGVAAGFRLGFRA
jgi:hypothetical protein